MTRKLIATAACGALALGVTACGRDNNDDAGKPVASVDTLTGYTTKVTLATSFVKALTSLKVTPAPLGTAKISKSGVATFPITGGDVKYYKPGTVSPYVQGSIDHDGSGLSLTAGGTTVQLRNFIVDPGASVLTGEVDVNGTTAVASAPLFFLDGRTLKPLKLNKDQTKAVLQGTTVKLKAEAAKLLNKTFGIKALKSGLKIGVAKITINTK